MTRGVVDGANSHTSTNTRYYGREKVVADSEQQNEQTGSSAPRQDENVCGTRASYGPLARLKAVERQNERLR